MEKKIRKISTIFLCLLMVAVVFAVVPMNVGAEEGPPEDPPEEPELPEEPGLEGEGEWWIDAHGTYFELTNSPYLNITFTSSENIHLFLESIPKMINYHIERNCAADSTDITISGFEASTTYYRYQDSDLHEEFTTDVTGSYTYTQDISSHHHVFIQEIETTIYIRSDGTIDPSTAPIIKVDDTYTLTGNIYESIYIQKSDITLDGAGYTVDGNGGLGIMLPQISGVTIKNLNIKEFTYGIYLSESDGNTIIDNIASDNGGGIYLHYSNSNTINRNTASDKYYGIILYNSNNNIIDTNTISDSTRYGIQLSGYQSGSSTNTITANTVTSNRRGIDLSYSSTNTITDNTFSANTDVAIGISYSTVTITWNTFSGNPIDISTYNPIACTISDNTFSGFNIGVRLYGYSRPGFGGNTVSDNTFSGSSTGIDLYYTYGNIIEGNTILGSPSKGVRLYHSDGNTVDGNSISGTIYTSGLSLEHSDTNTINSNTVSDNIAGIYLYNSNSNTMWGNTVLDNTNFGFGITSSSDNSVNDNTITGNTDGIELHSCSSTTIVGNTVSSNADGISLGSSDSNTIGGNIVSGNTNYGIYLSYSNSNTIIVNTVSYNGYGTYLYYASSNTFFHNNFDSNTNQLYNYASSNIWDNGAGEGNFWSDYTGSDLNNDGIGDTNLPHQVVDWYPLMTSWYNAAPSISSFTSTESIECTPVIFTVTASDTDGDFLTYSFDFDSDGIIDVTGSSNSVSKVWCDDQSGPATVYVRDGELEAKATTPVFVANALPEVIITGPETGSVFPINTPVTFNGTFSDVGTLDTHTAEWKIGYWAIPGIVTENEGSGTVTCTFTFPITGVFMVRLTVTDDDDGAGETDTFNDLPAMVVIYDPEGGFVTGGGWFDSPAGAFIGDQTLTGRATFGFVSKYNKGKCVPDGNLEFQFHAGDLNFHSTSYDWLIIAGPKGMFKGTGMINDQGNYGFQVSAIDGDLPGGEDVDRIHIKIWDKDNEDAIIYDNYEDPYGGAEFPETPIHGQIKVHKT